MLSSQGLNKPSILLANVKEGAMGNCAIPMEESTEAVQASAKTSTCVGLFEAKEDLVHGEPGLGELPLRFLSGLSLVPLEQPWAPMRAVSCTSAEGGICPPFIVPFWTHRG